MPPLVIAALGAAGAVVLARFLVREGRRVNDLLDPHRAAPAKAASAEAPFERLERDPVTGAYRPAPRS